MELLKQHLSKYQIPQQQEQSKIQSWQEYALEVCNDFKLTGQYRAMIFRHAKTNIQFLKGKVENCKEKFGLKLENKGNYFISLFRKRKPWEN